MFTKLGTLLKVVWKAFHRGNTSVGGALWLILSQCLILIRKGGYRGLKAHIIRHMRMRSTPPEEYDRWVKAHAPNQSAREAMARQSLELAHRPIVSILMSVRAGHEEKLDRSFQSIFGQAYPFWELVCVTEEASYRRTTEMVEGFGSNDARMRILPDCGERDVSGCFNRALASAEGEFICVMEPGDEISPDALFEIARATNTKPNTDMFYSDEDTIDVDGARTRPFFKPDWSPEYLESFPYIGRLSAYRTALSRAIGGFRQGFNGSAEYDFQLRFTERTQLITHLPKVLYHRMRLPDAPSGAPTPSPAANDSLTALTDRLQRLHPGGTVREIAPQCFDVRRPIIGTPLVSIVIPSAGKRVRVRGTNTDLLSRCVELIRSKSTYPHYEILVVDNGNLASDTLETLSRAGCRFIHFLERVPNVARKMNMGASAAKGDHLLFLNDDTEVISPDWMEAMLQYSQQPDIGAVGAKLYFEDGSVQHAGVTLNDDGLPDYLCRGFPGSEPGYFFSLAVSRACLAVTGACLMVKRPVFEEIGGFDEALAMSYNDIDFCLKLHAAGYRNVFTPHARLFHYEFVTRARTVDFSESDRFLQRWRKRVPHDPYYNIHLDTYPPSYRIRRFPLPQGGNTGPT